MNQLTPVNEAPRSFYLKPVVNIDEALAARQEVKQVVANYLIEGEDWGTIPGAGKKPTLLKPGAEKLCETFGLYPEYEVITEAEDWDRSPPLFDYKIKCTLRTQGTNIPVGSGLGSCSSYESKYRYRTARMSCPGCGSEALMKSKYGEGYYCNPKGGGCGQNTAAPKGGGGKVENPDIADQKNTVLKMACKRAMISATITAIHASDMFTQDLEDLYATATVVKEVTPPSPPSKDASRKLLEEEECESWGPPGSARTAKEGGARTASASEFEVEEAKVVAAESIMAPLPPPTPLNELDLGNGGFIDLYKAVKDKGLSKTALVMMSEDLGCTANLQDLWAQSSEPAGVVALEAILKHYKVSIALPPGAAKKVVKGLTADVFEKVMEAINNV